MQFLFGPSTCQVFWLEQPLPHTALSAGFIPRISGRMLHPGVQASLRLSTKE